MISSLKLKENVGNEVLIVFFFWLPLTRTFPNPQGEDICDGVAREVEEETGVCTLLAFQ